MKDLQVFWYADNRLGISHDNLEYAEYGYKHLAKTLSSLSNTISHSLALGPEKIKLYA